MKAAEELIQKWINEKRCYISENEIKENGLSGKIALLILQENYEAKYLPSDDAHFCGGYSFKNPLGHYEKLYGLYYMYPQTETKEIKYLSYFKAYDEAIKEIVRLEYGNIYWKHKEDIPKYIQQIKKDMIKNIYIKNRYWFIWEEEVWVV